MPTSRDMIGAGCALALLAGCPAEFGPATGSGDASASSSTTFFTPATSEDTPTGDGGDGPGPPTSASGAEASTGDLTGSSGTTQVGDTCGDGVLDPGEGCDEGADNSSFAACTNACQPNVCGDGDVHLGVETCDEGEENVDSGYCRSDCQLGTCGDGYLFAGQEACDAGDANDAGKYGHCDEKCTINRCGDGEHDADHEECDDGPNNGTGMGGEQSQAGCDVDCGYFGRRIFLSSQSFSGDMGTRAGADLACQIMAAQVGFKDEYKYRAFLADASGSPNTFVDPDPGGPGRPFILPGGLIVAASYPALIAEGPGAGITTTEQGEVLFEKRVWTNLDPFGDAYLEDPASTCAEWSSADVLKSARVGVNAVAPGDPAALAEWQAQRHWLSFKSVSCKVEYRIYCIEAM